MKMPLVGAGIAGLVSAVAFALFPLEGSSPLKAGDLLDTLVSLGMTFAAVLIVGFASGSKKLSDPGRKAASPASIWCKECPRCRRVVRKRIIFCPDCGADLNNTTTGGQGGQEQVEGPTPDIRVGAC